MLLTISFGQAIYPLAMLIITGMGILINFWLAKKYNQKFREDELNKKADKIYVDHEIEKVEKETDLKFLLVKESGEETKAIAEQTLERVNFIANKFIEKGIEGE